MGSYCCKPSPPRSIPTIECDDNDIKCVSTCCMIRRPSRYSSTKEFENTDSLGRKGYVS